MGNGALKTIALGTLTAEQITFLTLKLFALKAALSFPASLLPGSILRVPGPILELCFTSREMSRRKSPESGAECIVATHH